MLFIEVIYINKFSFHLILNYYSKIRLQLFVNHIKTHLHKTITTFVKIGRGLQII